MLTNKALAYLSTKKTNNILKSYEESFNSNATTKFLNSSTSKSMIKRIESGKEGGTNGVANGPPGMPV